MARRSSKVLTGSMFGVCVLLAVCPCSAQIPAAPSVMVKLEKQVITQHEPVIIDFTLTNPSSRGVGFELGYGYEKLDVEVTDPEGRAWTKPPRFPLKGNNSLGFKEAIQVAAGATGTASVLLNEWFSFDKLGKYRIAVATIPSESSSTWDLHLPETMLRLTVLPRNAIALKAACAELAKRVGNTSSVEDSETAAKALASVEDPVAVPYMVEAMKRKPFSSVMIGALARLKTPSAIEALISASRSSDPETRSLAHAALVALGRAGPRQ